MTKIERLAEKVAEVSFPALLIGTMLFIIKILC